MIYWWWKYGDDNYNLTVYVTYLLSRLRVCRWRRTFLSVSTHLLLTICSLLIIYTFLLCLNEEENILKWYRLQNLLYFLWVSETPQLCYQSRIWMIHEMKFFFFFSGLSRTCHFQSLKMSENKMKMIPYIMK